MRGNVLLVQRAGGDRRDARARHQAGPEHGRLRALVNLLIDYAEVISHPPDEHGMADLAARSGLSHEEFRRRYWEHRLPYDVGGSARDYWATVFGRTVDADELALLIRRDVDNWTQLNHDTLDVLRVVHERGTRWRCSPTRRMARRRDRGAAGARVPRRPRVQRPDRRRQAGAKGVPRRARGHGPPRREVVFVDDRDENVASARELGLRRASTRLPTRCAPTSSARASPRGPAAARGRRRRPRRRPRAPRPRTGRWRRPPRGRRSARAQAMSRGVSPITTVRSRGHGGSDIRARAIGGSSARRAVVGAEAALAGREAVADARRARA